MVPAVSVVVATRNYGRFLAGALRSVLGQTWRDFELLIIDDGSTDDTAEVVRLFLNDRRVRYHRTDGLGQSRAKNLGIQLTRAPLVAFLDGDDEWLPTKLERQLPLFDNPAVGVVYSGRKLIDAASHDLPTPRSVLVRGQIYDDLLVRNPVCFSSVVVRRAAFDAVGLFDPALPLSIDYDLWLRVARHFEFDHVDAPLVRYRTGHANLSSRITERLMAILSVLRRSLHRRRNRDLADHRAQAEAWGSTCRTMGFALREEEPSAAARWYVRAARHDRRWAATVRSIAAMCLRKIVGLMR
jgi:glycosyltransferase involved in cell wall biosynthesis